MMRLYLYIGNISFIHGLMVKSDDGLKASISNKQDVSCFYRASVSHSVLKDWQLDAPIFISIFLVFCFMC